jgi:hypothetical protein
MHPDDEASEPRLVLGYDVETGEPFSLPFEGFRRGMTVRGPLGSGKTTFFNRFLTTFGLLHNVLHLDYSGTGTFLFQTFIANLVAMLRAAGKHAPSVRAFARTLLEQHAFGVVGGDDSPMPVRINLLKRRRLADGSLESLAQVVDRVLLVLDLKLNTQDPQVRVRCRLVCTALLTALVAAERPISEAVALLRNRLFATFVFAEIEARTFSAFDREFLVPQLHELHEILGLFDPSKPATRRQFLEEIGSTHRTLADFLPGKPLGRFFGSSETFEPERVAFGRQSLSLSVRITDAVVKKQVFQALHGVFEALFASRVRTEETYVPVTVLTDEITWLPLHIAEAMAIARNFDVSYILAFQNLAQWKAIGLDTMPDQLSTLTELSISMRPTTMAEAEDEVLHTTWIQPGAVVQRFASHAESSGQGTSRLVTEGSTDTVGTMQQESHGTAHGKSAVASVSASTSTHEAESAGTSSQSSRGRGQHAGKTTGGSDSTFVSDSESDTIGSMDSDGYGAAGMAGTGVQWAPDGTPHFSERDGTSDSMQHAAGTSSASSFASASGTGTAATWAHQAGESTIESDSESVQESTSKGSGRARGHARSRGTTASEMDGTTAGTSHSTARNTGTALGDSQQTSETVAEVLNILPCHEQLFPLAQAALRRPRLQGNARYEGSAVNLHFPPAVEFSAYLCGVPVLAYLLDEQSSFFESHAVTPSLYDPRALFLQPATTARPAVSTAPVAPPTPDQTASFTPGAPTPAQTIPKRPIDRGRADRNRR